MTSTTRTQEPGQNQQDIDGFRTISARDLIAMDPAVLGAERTKRLQTDAEWALGRWDELHVDISPTLLNARAMIRDLEIGRLEWDQDNHLGAHISRIETHPMLRRRGIATLLYNTLRVNGINVEHSNFRTSDGAAWARAVSPENTSDFDHCGDEYDPIW